MNTNNLMRHFARIGAELKIDIVSRIGPTRSRPVSDFTLDIGTHRRHEVFVLNVRSDRQDTLEFMPLDVRPAQRHLLLLAKQPDRNQKFLCGHDERHWFVAATDGALNVRTALDVLKPPVVRALETATHLRHKERNQRHNAAFMRQGEWFFLPRPRFTPPQPIAILRNEPIQRSGGKPHIVEYVYRHGGVAVYVCDKYPRGLVKEQYQRLLARKPDAAHWAWRLMQRTPQVYARGKVRHPDHRTIELPFWHLVMMNAETRSDNVVFLD